MYQPEYFVSPRAPGVRPQDPPNYDGITFVYIFTEVLSSWVQPPVQGNVTLVVANAQGFVSGMTIVIEGAGYYQVVSTDALNRMTVMNFGTLYNQPPGTGIAPGKVTTTSLPGPPGGVGPQGPQGIQGPVGPPLNPKGTVATTSALPSSGNTAGDLWITSDTAHAHAWTGISWADLGPFQGPQGPQGPPGGASANTTLTATFTMPASGSTALASVANAGVFGLGAVVFIQGLGYLGVTNVNTGANQLTLQNFGYAMNAAQGSTVPSATTVTGSGPQGPQGATGSTGSQGPAGPTAVSTNANNKATLGSDSLLLVQGVAAGVAATTHAQTVSGDDPQLTNSRAPTAHHTSHEHGGSDPVAITYSDLLSIPASFIPANHAPTHKSGGADAIALDTLAAPTDITTLNASTSAHGLLRKLDNTAAHYLDGTGAWSTPPINTGPAGPTGAAGANAYTATAVGSFTVPAVGATTTVNVTDASWIVIGQLLYFDTAGGGAGQAGALQVTAKSGNQLTVLNLAPPSVAPIADATQNGLLRQVSGLATDYVGGDNTCHALPVGLITRTTAVELFDDFTGNVGTPGTVPFGALGWLLANYSAANGSLANSAVSSGPELGVWQFSAPTSGTGVSQLMVGSIAAGFTIAATGQGTLVAEWRVKVSGALETISNYADHRFGINGTNTGVANWAAAYFQYNVSIGPNWQCVSYNGTTAISADSGVAVSTSAYVKLTITMNAAWTTATFAINGVTVATLTGVSFGAGVGWTPIAAAKWGAGSPSIMLMDWFYAKYSVTR